MRSIGFQVSSVTLRRSLKILEYRGPVVEKLFSLVIVQMGVAKSY